jgi:hypothetical protein
MKYENLVINLSLLKISHPLGILRLLLSRHRRRGPDACDAPTFIADPTSRYCLSLTLRIAQHPTVDCRASILLSLRMCRLRTHLKLEKEHRHLKTREVG